MKQGEKTQQLILEKANILFYHHGYNNTSFSDIVEKTGLSKGNITYHFKNKQAILKGIINKRMQEIQQNLDNWNEKSKEPKQRLLLFLEMIGDESGNLELYGCPMGTLTGEFSKNQPELYQITLPLFQTFRKWLTEQYILLNFSQKLADEKAMELLSRVQGIAVVTHAFKDKNFLLREIGKIKQSL